MDPTIPSTPITPTSTPKKVLCIEDEHFIGELYGRALEKAGYDVTIIVDGLQGLREAQTNRYDIILLDLMVPNMTGMEILRHLRNTLETPGLRAKILVTTNLEQRPETRQAIEQQADGYIIKADITPKELALLLDKLN